MALREGIGEMKDVRPEMDGSWELDKNRLGFSLLGCHVSFFFFGYKQY